MKTKYPKFLAMCRIKKGPLASTEKARFCGAFQVRCKGIVLAVISSDEKGWDHVSVSHPFRCPTWEEMDYVKSIFWDDSEIVSQYHVNDDRKVCNCKYCLHMWKMQGQEIELPPPIMVGLI